jgi:excisionase family DNA binding protein
VGSTAELPLLLTMTEAAALLRIGRTTVYKLAELHRSTLGASGIPTVRIGTKLFVRRADFERIVSGPDEAA